MTKRTKIVVCGVTGFIGRNIAESLAARPENEVVGIHFTRPEFDNAAIEFRRLDLRDPEQVDQALSDADVVIQAAATTSGSKDIVSTPYIHVTDNAVMNSHILRSVFHHKIKHFVFFSCTVMYPSSAMPLKETDFDANGAMEPKYFGAAWTKLYIEKMCEFYAGICDTKFTVLRHSNVYGPYDKFDLSRSHVFGATVTKVMTASDGKVVVWGEGKEARDLIYVSDMVNCVELALEKQGESFGLYNVGAGEAVRIRDLVGRIIAASGRDLAIEHDLSKPAIPTSLTVDCGRIQTALGWTPQVSLDEGISKTLAWFAETYGLDGALLD